MREIQVCSKNYGIDTDLLFQDKVIGSEICFWSLLQSHSDRFHYFYYDEESIIKKALSRLEEKKESLRHEDILILLGSVKERVFWLLEFILYNLKLFADSVRTFDKHHNLETFDEEMDYFLSTYSFVDGQRLQCIKNSIDKWILDIKQISCSHAEVEEDDVKDKEESNEVPQLEKSTVGTQKQSQNRSQTKGRRPRSSFLWKRSKNETNDDKRGRSQSSTVTNATSSNLRGKKITTFLVKIYLLNKRY